MAVMSETDAVLEANLPGTAHLGLILLERVDVERQSGGLWSQIAAGVPATFEPLSLHTRAELATWTHKPLFCLWLYPSIAIADGDRIKRGDGSDWYVRGTPFFAPRRTHYVAIVEATTEDTLFAPIAP